MIRESKIIKALFGQRFVQSSAVRDERGFTLVEIIMVLIIIGIVMAFVANSVFGAGDKAKRSLTETKAKMIGTSIDQFRLKYNALPQSIEDLTRCNDVTGPGCVPITNQESLRDGWGNSFLFNLENGGRSYRIKSLGADGREGGEGVDFDYSQTGP